MNLPTSNNLPVQKLSSVFGSTVATYKYYWLIAIIELVEEGNIEIAKKKIFSRMISNSWYTINYFHISFGKQDNLQIIESKFGAIPEKEHIISYESNIDYEGIPYVVKKIIRENLKRQINPFRLHKILRVWILQKA